MSTTRVTCPHCGIRFYAPPSENCNGQTICSKCGQTFYVDTVLRAGSIPVVECRCPSDHIYYLTIAEAYPGGQEGIGDPGPCLMCGREGGTIEKRLENWSFLLHQMYAPDWQFYTEVLNTYDMTKTVNTRYMIKDLMESDKLKDCRDTRVQKIRALLNSTLVRNGFARYSRKSSAWSKVRENT